jgi:hypothetical protein
MVAFDPVPSRTEAQLDRVDARLDRFDERLRAVEQSCARLEGKMDMMLLLGGGRLPKWWHAPVAVGAAVVALLGLRVLAQLMGIHGPP